MIQATWLKNSLCATHYVYVWEGSSDLFFFSSVEDIHLSNALRNRSEITNEQSVMKERHKVNEYL